jgi:hypothetical protein
VVDDPTNVPISATYTVRNTESTAGEVTVALKLDRTVLTRETVWLRPGQSKQRTLSATTDLGRGFNQVKVNKVDVSFVDDGGGGGTDTGGDTGDSGGDTGGTDEWTGQYADLLSIDTNPSVGIRGEYIRFEADVRNNTSRAGAPVTVTFYFDGQRIGRQSRTLGAGDTQTIGVRTAVSSLPVGQGYWTYKAVLDVRSQSRTMTVRIR